MALEKVPEHLLVRQSVEEEKSNICTINKRQRAWLGQTLRHGDLLPIVNGSTGQNQEWQLVPINKVESIRSETIRLDLSMGRTHTV